MKKQKKGETPSGEAEDIKEPKAGTAQETESKTAEGTTPETEPAAITPEEFKKLEKKEGKGNVIGRIFKKKGKVTAHETDDKNTTPGNHKETVTPERLLLMMEKLEGRMEVVNSRFAAVEERMSRLSEEIGEQRSALLEKDRTIRSVEKGFNETKEIMETMEPGKFKTQLEMHKKDSLENLAKIESVDNRLETTRKTVKQIEDLLSKIKGFENLVGMYDKMTKKLENIEGDRRFITKTAGKTESLFHEITERTKEFGKYKGKIDFNQETLHEMMKSLDAVEVKLDSFVSKDALGKIQDGMNEDNTRLNDRIEGLKDVLEDMISSLKDNKETRKRARKKAIHILPKRPARPEQPKRIAEPVAELSEPAEEPSEPVEEETREKGILSRLGIKRKERLPSPPTAGRVKVGKMPRMPEIKEWKHELARKVPQKPDITVNSILENPAQLTGKSVSIYGLLGLSHEQIKDGVLYTFKDGTGTITARSQTRGLTGPGKLVGVVEKGPDSKVRIKIQAFGSL